MYPLIRRAVTITSANQRIRWQEGATVGIATVAQGTYWLRDSGVDSLLLAVKAAIEAVTASTNTYTLTSTRSVLATQPTGTVTITKSSGADTFALLGAPHVLNTFPLHALGFAVDTALDVLPIVSTKSPSAIWVSNDMLAIDEPDVRGEVFGEDPSRGGVVVAGAQSDPWDEYLWELAYVARNRVWQEANAVDPNATWEAFWRRIRSGPVLELARLAPQTFTMTDLAGQWVLDKPGRERIGVARLNAGNPVYRWPLRFQKWVTP